MKRKITDLEQRLIDKGYYLSHKHYGGRKSEKTISYMYVNKNAFVKLDNKREQVVDYGLLNYHAMELTTMELKGIELLLDMIKSDFKVDNKSVINVTQERSCELPLDEPTTNLEIAQYLCDYDESDELGEMTFEQFDELCKEKEQWNKLNIQKSNY